MVADILTLSTMALAAFGSATLLPGGSEVVFAGFLAAGYGHPALLLAVAALANTLGGLTSWWIGRLIADGAESARGRALAARFRLSPVMLARVQRLFGRYGWAALALCWLPVIGDPITLVAGMARYPFWPTALITGLARALRYGAVWAGTAGLTGALGW